MRLHFDLSEYENEEDGGTRVLLTVNLPDGQQHTKVTEIYEKAVSILYGYDIGGNHDRQFSFDFDDEDLDDGENFKACSKCVQGTCVMGCGREFA